MFDETSTSCGGAVIFICPAFHITLLLYYTLHYHLYHDYYHDYYTDIMSPTRDQLLARLHQTIASGSIIVGAGAGTPPPTPPPLP